MKKHNGMRPQDIVILLKIALQKDSDWFIKDLAYELGISQGEVSESLNRSVYAGLLASDKKTLMTEAFMDFLFYGFRYIFPQRPGREVRGLPTAHSAPPLKGLIQSEKVYVWPFLKGSVKGFCIEPLHPGVPEACLRDANLYELLALADALRAGKIREQNLAMEEIKKRLNREKFTV